MSIIGICGKVQAGFDRIKKSMPPLKKAPSVSQPPPVQSQAAPVTLTQDNADCRLFGLVREISAEAQNIARYLENLKKTCDLTDQKFAKRKYNRFWLSIYRSLRLIPDTLRVLFLTYIGSSLNLENWLIGQQRLPNY
jgi:hypothetical protein